MRRTALLLVCVVLLAGILPSETFAGSSYSLDCQNTEQTIWVTKGEPVWLYFNPNLKV
jgi:hypothetical protein